MLNKSIFKNTFLFIVLVIFSCGNSLQNKVEEPQKNTSSKKSTKESKSLLTNLLTGADQPNLYLPLLKDKKIGIVTNQTGIMSTKIHLVDFLIKKNILITTIFAPEHGFRGTADAGELIKDGKDIKTGLPIVSLYGSNKKPKKEQLSNIDCLLFDLQDVGARFYTYISTLHYVMEACAENNIPLIILDRPNPNGGIIDGPVLEKENQSFVGMHEIPVLHGMTIGEYAQMINGEKWLKNGLKCTLSVVKCFNYSHNSQYSLLVKPSPNLPNDQAINLYASLCFFEGTNVSVGRGTDKQFQIYGSPYLPKSNFKFTPKPNEGAKDPLYNSKVCYGEDLSGVKKVKQLELKWLIKAYHETNDQSKFFNPFFTKLAGTKTLQKQIQQGETEDAIRESWKADLDKFKITRSKYLLYD